MRHSVRVLSLCLWLALLASCGGSSSGPSGSTVHGLTITVAIANVTLDKPLVEVALLIDGIQVGSSTTYPGGTGNARLDPVPIGVTAGSHRVAFKVVQQRYASVPYIVAGTVIGSNDATGVLVRQDFPQSATLKAGDQVEVTVNVP